MFNGTGSSQRPTHQPSIAHTQLLNGIGGGLKPTFLEGFAKIYAYPYGSSFLPRECPQDTFFEPVALENTIAGVATFERSLLKKRLLRPFHVDCGVTKKRVCYCSNDVQT